MAKKKAKKKINKKQLSPPERHFGMVLEDIDSKLDLVVEGHQGLDKKIEDFRKETGERFDEMDYKFEIVFEKFDEIDAQFNKVDERFNKVDERFDNVDAQFNNVKDELYIIRNELKEKVGRDEFTLLEKRVIALEKSRKN